MRTLLVGLAVCCSAPLLTSAAAPSPSLREGRPLRAGEGTGTPLDWNGAPERRYLTALPGRQRPTLPEERWFWEGGRRWAGNDPTTLAAVRSPQPATIAPASIGSSLIKAVAKYFGKEGSQEASEYLAREGSQQMLQRVAQSAARQGGDEAVEGVARLARQYGPDALRAFDQSPSVVPLLKALDDLPQDQVGPALSRLAAGSQGRELAEAVTRYGAAALRSELKHPGVGVVLVRQLGDDGAELASRLTTDQAVAVGRHAETIATLPSQQRAGVLSLLHRDTERMVAFMGRFVENNPGKSLFTVATTTVLLAESDRILGGDEVVFDAEGNPIVVSKDGVLGRSIKAGGSAAAHLSERYLQPLFLAALVFFGLFATLWTLMKFWSLHRANNT